MSLDTHSLQLEPSSPYASKLVLDDVWLCPEPAWGFVVFVCHLVRSPQIQVEHWFWLENDPRSEGNKSSCKQACLWVCYPVIIVSMLALFLASAQQEMQFHIVLAKIWVYFWECLCLCRCRHATCLLSLSLSQGSTALPIRQSKRLVKMKGPRSYFTNVFRWSLKEIKKICLLP